MASWKALSGVPNFFADTMLLLTDGSVFVHDASASLLGGVNWYRLTPDSNGKYDTPGATWTGPFPWPTPGSSGPPASSKTAASS
jgi:hypothetical protein